MGAPEKQLERIQEKLQALLKLHAGLQKENAQLKKQVDQFKSRSAEQENQIESLRQLTSVLKMNAGELDAADKKELERKINGYLKEIDRCIALLGQ